MRGGHCLGNEAIAVENNNVDSVAAYKQPDPSAKHQCPGTADTVRVPSSSSLSYAVMSTIQPCPSSTLRIICCFKHPLLSYL